MYAAYLYIFQAFDSAAASRLAKSPDPEREIARWPVAECCSRPSPFAFTSSPHEAGLDPREDRANW
jgi:hypothetical protein